MRMVKRLLRIDRFDFPLYARRFNDCEHAVQNGSEAVSKRITPDVKVKEIDRFERVC